MSFNFTSVKFMSGIFSQPFTTETAVFLQNSNRQLQMLRILILPLNFPKINAFSPKVCLFNKNFSTKNFRQFFESQRFQVGNCSPFLSCALPLAWRHCQRLYLKRSKNPFLVWLSMRRKLIWWEHVVEDDGVATVDQLFVTSEQTGALTGAVSMWLYCNRHADARADHGGTDVVEYNQCVVVHAICDRHSRNSEGRFVHAQI